MAMSDPRTSVDTPARGSVSFAPPHPPAPGPMPGYHGERAPVAVRAGRPEGAAPIEIPQSGLDDVKQFPVQIAKVQRPPLRDETLRRDRLLNWLHAKIHSRVVLLTAEAGYGKTTLLADFSRRTRLRTLWYRLDEQDRDWISVMNHLVVAGREVHPGFATATAGLLREISPGGPNRDAIVDTFIRELSELGHEGAIVIIDDFHVVDASAEIRHVMRQLIARAPERVTFVFASRRPPSIPMARLRALGEVVELTTGDLRFDEAETEQLFRETYRRPLDADVLVDLGSRTEGWAASLQLVQTALRDRSAVEIRTFIRNLTGAQGDLYDYLAEEVVGEQDAATQQFLMRTSILQVVDPERSGVVTGVEADAGRRHIEAAERLGLLSRRGSGATLAHRYHPLVRDFLQDRLRREIGERGLIDLHRQVAMWADSRDWRLAAFHYGAAGDLDAVRRVLTAAIQTIMSTGEYELAESLIDQYAPSDHDVVYEVIRSRMDVLRGDLDRATERARTAFDLADTLPEALRAPIQLNWMSVAGVSGNAAEAARVANYLQADNLGDKGWRDIPRALLLVLESSLEGGVENSGRLLRRMARNQSGEGQTHLLGITELNLGNVFRSQSNPLGAREAAEKAVEALSKSSRGHEVASARQLHAWACAALGDFGGAEEELRESVNSSHVLERGEGLIEWAEVHVWFGDANRAIELLDDAFEYVETLSDVLDWWRVVAAFAQIRLRNFELARKLLKDSPLDQMTLQTALKARKLAASAALAALERSETSGPLVESAVELAHRQGATLWESFVRLVGSQRDFQQLDRELRRLLRSQPWTVSMAADWLVPSLGNLDNSNRERLGIEILRRPERWRDALRLQLDAADGSAIEAARLLDDIGETEDVPRLRAFAKRARARGASPHLGKGLARRLARRVFVEDQGRVIIRVGEREIQGTEVRRKVLALLCFLLTRPGFSATRDAVLEAMWPDLEPEVAVNSLNQTIYFLRRVFEDSYKEDLSPGYVHHASDVLWLDPELVDSRTAVCRRLLRSIGVDPDPDAVEELSNAYLGKFALDFAYDDWAGAYRDSLHASYLEVVEAASTHDTKTGHFGRAIRIVQRAIEVDPDADDLEASLLRLYQVTGSHAAAAEQYSHYSTSLRRDLGIDPPPLESMVELGKVTY